MGHQDVAVADVGEGALEQGFVGIDVGRQLVAEETGGRFFRARDTRELAGIYAELDRLEPVRGSGPAVRPRIERYPWPLAAALLIGLVGLAWPGRRA